MFERELEECTTLIYFTDKEVSVLDRNGVGVFTRGNVEFDYYKAADLVEKMKRIMPSVSKRDLPVYKARLNSIRVAFGPEFIERH